MQRKIHPMSTRYLLSIFAIVLILILFLFPASSLKGAENGVLLWFNVILPTLLPFIIASSLIINLNLTSKIATIFYPFLHALFHVSKNGCYPILIGLISGFPVGAKACGDLTRQQKITANEGQFLLTICNNASPMFIISFIAITTVKQANIRYSLLIIIIVSALLTGLTYRILMNLLHKDRLDFTVVETDYAATTTSLSNRPKRFTFEILDGAIMDGFDVVTKVGGYIILFSILSQVILDLSITDGFINYISIGLLEITNGINTIGAAGMGLGEKIVLIMTITAFGGMSSLAQTKSVIDNSGLSIKTYFIYKLINAAYVFVLTVLFVTTCLS